MITKKIIIFGAGMILLALFPDTAIAFTYIPLEEIPGTAGTNLDFPAYVIAIYKFAVWTVGIAALLMMTIGGFMYFTSAGNNASMEKAKSVITDSIYGVLAVLLAYLILYVINPDLVNVDMSSLNVIRSEVIISPGVSLPASINSGREGQAYSETVSIHAGANVASVGVITVSGCPSGFSCDVVGNDVRVSHPSAPGGEYELGIQTVWIDNDGDPHTDAFKTVSFRITTGGASGEWE